MSRQVFKYNDGRYICYNRYNFLNNRKISAFKNHLQDITILTYFDPSMKLKSGIKYAHLYNPLTILNKLVENNCENLRDVFFYNNRSIVATKTKGVAECSIYCTMLCSIKSKI